MALLNNTPEQAFLSNQAQAMTSTPPANQDLSSSMLIGKTHGSNLGVYFYQNIKDKNKIMYQHMKRGKNMEPVPVGPPMSYNPANFNYLNPDMTKGEKWIGADKLEWIRVPYIAPSLNQVREETLTNSNFDPKIHEPVDFTAKLAEFNKLKGTNFGPDDVGGSVIFGKDAYFKPKSQKNLVDYSKDIHRTLPTKTSLINNYYQQAK